MRHFNHQIVSGSRWRNWLKIRVERKSAFRRSSGRCQFRRRALCDITQSGQTTQQERSWQTNGRTRKRSDPDGRLKHEAGPLRVVRTSLGLRGPGVRFRARTVYMPRSAAGVNGTDEGTDGPLQLGIRLVSLSSRARPPRPCRRRCGRCTRSRRSPSSCRERTSKRDPHAICGGRGVVDRQAGEGADVRWQDVRKDAENGAGQHADDVEGREQEGGKFCRARAANRMPRSPASASSGKM